MIKPKFRGRVTKLEQMEEKTAIFLKRFRTNKELLPDRVTNAMRVQMNRLIRVCFCFFA